MDKLKRKIQVAVIILFPLFLSTCFCLEIEENVKNPDRYFKKAYRQIEEIHQKYPNREGRPRHIHLLIYDGSDRQIIKMAVPLWMANGCMDLGREAAEIDSEFDFEEGYDFDWKGIRDLGQLGPGLLVEVDAEEEKILIWLK